MKMEFLISLYPPPPLSLSLFPLLVQKSSMMPEVRDLSDALPELPMDPITGVGVVASRNRAPTGYDVVSVCVCDGIWLHRSIVEVQYQKPQVQMKIFMNKAYQS